MERHELKGNWITLTEDQAADLVYFGDRLTPEERHSIINRPAVKDIMFEVSAGKQGAEIIFCETITPETIPEKAMQGRTAISENGVRLSIYNAIGRTVKIIFQSHIWVGIDGEIEGAFNTTPERMARINKKEVYDHEDDLIEMYFAVQYLMLHEPELFSGRRAFQKGMKAAKGELPLVGPYTRPGKVVMYQMRSLNGDDADRIIRKHRMTAWHCPAWGVRGHYRHYKTGKVSYVKPYVKGKNRAAYAGREYALPGGGAITEVLK